MVRSHFSSNMLVSSYAFSSLLFNLLHFTMAAISILTVPWIIALANRSILHKKEAMTTINEKMKFRNMKESSFQEKSEVSELYQELFCWSTAWKLYHLTPRCAPVQPSFGHLSA